MKKIDEQRTISKKELDELEMHIIVAVGKALEETKTELKTDIEQVRTELKTEIKQTKEELGLKIDRLSYDVSDLRNRVVSLEIKHGSPHAHTA